MTFTQDQWSSILQEKFPNELEKVKTRDQNLPSKEEARCAHFESTMFEKGVNITDPRYLETDDVIWMLVSYFSKYTLHVEHDERFEGVINTYRMELGGLLQGWSDEALKTVAKSYQTMEYRSDRMFELFEKCQGIYLEYQNYLAEQEEKTQ